MLSRCAQPEVTSEQSCERIGAVFSDSPLGGISMLVRETLTEVALVSFEFRVCFELHNRKVFVLMYVSGQRE